MCGCVRAHACVGIAGVYLRRKCSSRMSGNVDLLRHCLLSVVKKKIDLATATMANICFFPGSQRYSIRHCIAEHTGVKSYSLPLSLSLSLSGSL